MKHIQRLILVVCVPFAAAFAADLPEQLQHLEDIEDERAAVDAMRNFQLLQEALVDWDSQLASQYMEGDQRSLAETKAEDLRARLDAVEAGWQYMLERYPENPRVNNYYGEYVYDHTRDHAAGVQYWLRAVALDEDFAPGHNNLGVHYLHGGSVRLGLQHLHTAIELDPDHPDYLFNITQAYLNYRRDVQRWYDKDLKKVYDDAMKFSQRAAELAPDDLQIVQDYAVNFYAAENFDVSPNWNDAAAAWDKVIALATDPSDQFYAVLNKARVMIRMEKWPEAIALLEQCQKMNPDSEVVESLLTQSREQLEGGGKKEKKRRG